MPKPFIQILAIVAIIFPFFLLWSDAKADIYKGLEIQMEKSGILEGVEEEFQGHKTISRGEFLQWSINLTQAKINNQTTNLPFVDITEDDTYFEAIQTSYQAGALDMFEKDTKLLPHRHLNKIEALEILYTLKGISLLEYTGDIEEIEWNDLPSSGKEKQIILLGIQNGYIQPQEEGFIEPFAPVTKNEAAWMISLLINEEAKISSTHQEFERLEEVQHLIKTEYWDTNAPSSDELEDAAISGMVESLEDPYSLFLQPEESEQFETFFEEDAPTEEQEYAGLGVVVQAANQGGMVITQVFEGSPAQVSDIRVGDIVVEVEGENVQHLSVAEIATQIKGPVNTSLNITIERNGDLIEKTFVRKKIFVENLSSLSTEIKDGIVWIRVRSFKTFTAQDFRTALEANVSDNTKGVIVDLRYNPGGILQTTQEMLGEVLSEGHTAVWLYSPKGSKKLPVIGSGEFTEIPMVVFQNEYSASASEIFSAAIQDYERGTIVGTQSFGKGVAQSLFYLKKGSLKLTTAEFRSPLQNKIHEVGVTPDVEVQNQDDESYFYEAKRILR